MILDFGGCWVIEKGCKALFANLEPVELVTRGKERREKRRLEERKEVERMGGSAGVLPELDEVTRKTQ
jgi:cation-transporting ATPase 13A1